MDDKLEAIRDPLSLLRLGYLPPLLEHPAVRWDGDRVEQRHERIAEEVPVALVYNGLSHVVMMATPADLEDFVLGFSLTEELVTAPEDLLGVEVVRYGQGIEVQVQVSPAQATAIGDRGRNLTGRTGCGICGSDSIAGVLKQLHPVRDGAPVLAAVLTRAMESLTSHQVLNAESGAVHAAGWASNAGDILVVREDVGRHNALDKLIGALARQRVDPASGFVLVTSRASFEMVQKTTVLGARILVAISGPTGLAVRVAQQSGLTLAGFARKGRLTVYTRPERVGGSAG